MAAVVPYAAVAAVLGWAFRPRLLQATLFRRGTRIFRQFSFGEAPPASAEATARSLAVNLFGAWRLATLTRCSEREFAHWVSVQGADILADSNRAERGVIVVGAHFGYPRLVPLVISRLGYAIHSMEADDLLARLNIGTAGRISVIRVRHNQSLLRQVYQARSVLQQGGIFHLAADGVVGTTGVDLPFCGRQRKFPTGFADLAALTRAPVIPAFAGMDVSGHFTVEFLRPLQPAPSDSDRTAQLDHLLRQYAALLAARWNADPANVRWAHIKMYKTWPIFDGNGACQK